MPTLLPTLPMHERILFPGMITRLHVIREAEVSAIDHHLASGRPLLALPLLIPGLEQIQQRDFSQVGVTAKVLRLVRLGDGTVRVLLEGLERANGSAIRPDPDAGLLTSARPLLSQTTDPDAVAALHERLRDHLNQLILKDSNLPPGLAKLVELDLTPTRLTDHIASNLVLPRAVLLDLLCNTNLDQRMAQVLDLLVRETTYREMETELNQRVQSTMDKQQRDYYLREKIRTMRKELGTQAEPMDEADVFEEKLRASGMPEGVLVEAMRELGRLRRMHPDAAEYNVARTWLEWLLAMPWKTTTVDNPSLAHALKTLNADHHGLNAVKDRILEHLAVRQLKPDGRGSVLCFLGPPGVGKTSLGQSIAKALGRKYQRVSLGGVKDESEIRGHRRTYVGALPGRIAHALKRAEAQNPVLVLDEIDKLGKDFRGDPAAALLEVLDPEQNNAFVDHYLDVPFDLSQVMFLCTANVRENIPPALLDRLEIIEIAGYILEEKVQIAKRHLVPKLLDSHGLSAQQLQLTTAAITHLIELYTQEAGVRGLERKLASLHRKAARRVVEGRRRNLRIHTTKHLKAQLGAPKHQVTLVEQSDAPGVAVGLAWTPSGGDILFVEAISYPGKEGIQLTGHLGDVMKESAQAALSLLRSRAVDLGLTNEQFQQSIHLHVPAGAIPKDGPSAGITLATAMASLFLNRPIRAHLAMTGELTLRGKVLAVGGIKEKILAARRAGATEVIMPNSNVHDLDEIPALLRKEMTFHFVETIDEVFALALPDATTSVAG